MLIKHANTPLCRLCTQSKHGSHISPKKAYRCPTAHEKMLNITIREVQIKTTMRYYLTLVRMAIIKMSTNNKCWRECGEKGTLLHCGWECKLVQSLWRTVWRFLRKLKIELPYDLAILLLGIYPDKTIIQKDTCTPLFMAAVFTIVKTFKQPTCPWTEEWIKKMWYIYAIEYYSAIKRNEIMPFAAMWMNLQIIILSQVSQTEKDKYHMISRICVI